MAQKKIVVYESKNLTISHYKTNGKRKPERVSITLPPRDGGTEPRRMAISIDELFDLTEALDDLCDSIEDAEDYKKGLSSRF